MKKILSIIMIFIMLVIIGCSTHPLTKKNNNISMLSEQKKNIIVVIVDSLMDEPLREAIKKGQAPAFQFFFENGMYYPEVVSSYPTMSVTIDSSLITGSYSDQHHVPGLVWYDGKENRIVNYGNGKREIMKIGADQVLKDALYQLNNKHLNPDKKTVYEELSNFNIEAASINNIVYRGDVPHSLKVPNTIAWTKITPKTIETLGPKWLSLGVLSQINPVNRHNRPWDKYGMNNDFSIQELKYLIQNQQLPSLTLVYLPDNDHYVHDKGPTALKGIKKTDKQLQEILNLYGDWKKGLAENIWIIMGDSGQTYIGKKRKEVLINLVALLDKYKIPKLSEPITREDQVVLGINERMAYVYSLDDKISLYSLAKKLQQDNRISLIAWKENEWIQVMVGGKEERISFKPNGKLKDQYGEYWTVKGDLNILDIGRQRNHLTYHSYPDVLARLHSALNSHQGRYIVVNAKPGYEFIGESTPFHLGGGGHGSIHRYDSLAPMIIIGTKTAPKYLRIIDFKDWLQNLILLQK